MWYHCLLNHRPIIFEVDDKNYNLSDDELQEYVETEICSQCHPFYTGKEKVLDTLGQVQKFKDKLAKKAKLKKKK